MNTAKRVLKMGNRSEQNKALFHASTACTVDFNDQDMTFTFVDGSQIRCEDGEMFEIKHNTIANAAVYTALVGLMALVMIGASVGAIYLAAMVASTLCVPLVLIIGGVACACSVATARTVGEMITSVASEWRLA